jgi:hypothetical protein
MGEHKKPKIKPGATGAFPYGKLDATDEGELMVQISELNGKVKVDFGKKIAWIAMSPDEMIDFSTVLMRRAMIIKTLRGLT